MNLIQHVSALPQIELTAKTCYIDFETTGLDGRCRVLILSIKFDLGPTYVVDVVTLGEQVVFEWLKPIMEDERIVKVAHNAVFEYQILYHRGIKTTPIRCTMIQEQLLGSGLLYAGSGAGLADTAKRRLGLDMSKKIRENFADRNPERDPLVEEEFAYAALDTEVLPEIYQQQLAELNTRKMDQVAELESLLIPVTARMEYDGVNINVEKLKELRPKLDELLERASIQLQDEFIRGGAAIEIVFSRDGYSAVNPRSTQQMKEAFNTVGIAITSLSRKELSDWDAKWAKKKNHVPVDADDELNIGFSHPLLRVHAIRTAAGKIKGTYVDGLLDRISPWTGRVHGRYNQCGAGATGRYSSSNPNMQNIPKLDKMHALGLGDYNIRAMFEPAPGYSFIISDYSGIELSILAAYSGDERLTHEILVGDIHSYVANELCGDKIIAVLGDYITKETKRTERGKAIRDQFKPVSYGTIYGSTGYNLYRTLYFPLQEQGIHITREDADEWVRRWTSELFPDTGAFLAKNAELAVTRYYTSSAYGRQRQWSSDVRYDKYRMLAAMREGSNHPIQATCADMLKLAMVKLDPVLAPSEARIAMTVHDELVLEVRTDLVNGYKDKVKQIMESAAQSLFPDANPNLFVAEPKVSERYDK